MGSRRCADRRCCCCATLLSVGVWLFEAGSYLLLSRGLNLGLPSNLELPGASAWRW